MSKYCKKRETHTCRKLSSISSLLWQPHNLCFACVCLLDQRARLPKYFFLNLVVFVIRFIILGHPSEWCLLAYQLRWRIFISLLINPMRRENVRKQRRNGAKITRQERLMQLWMNFTVGETHKVQKSESKGKPALKSSHSTWHATTFRADIVFLIDFFMHTNKYL